MQKNNTNNPDFPWDNNWGHVYDVENDKVIEHE